MEDSSPKKSKFIRVSQILYLILAGVILSWLSIENSSETIALLLGASLAILSTSILYSKLLYDRLWVLRTLTIGTLSGILVSPAAALLMIFKNGLHSHAGPDFTNEQIIEVLERTSYWAAGGLLLAISLGIWELTKRR